MTTHVPVADDLSEIAGMMPDGMKRADRLPEDPPSIVAWSPQQSLRPFTDAERAVDMPLPRLDNTSRCLHTHRHRNKKQPA